VNLKSVCLLLSLCHAGFAAALGLGDISVRSYLGQPLHVVVPLIDTTPATTPDCLSLGSSPGSIAPLLHAQLSIEQLGSQTLLHIRTTQSVSDPVTQFVLISDCEAHLQREYAVLLDPPVLVESAGQDVPSAATATASAPLASPAPAPAARRRQAHVRRASPAPARAIAAHSSLHATQPVHPAPATRPRLVLSGKRVGVSAPLALRLDTTLSDQSQPRAESLSPTDLSDENTALNRRLAYLEAQLTALQQRNAQLARASREAIPVAVTPPPAQPPTHWLLYLLVIALLVGAGALVLGLRRRRRPQIVHFGDDTWTQPDTRPADALFATDSAPMSPVLQRMPEIAAPPIDVGTELKEDILDQAEVFMAHGHSELAIHLLQEHLRESPTESPVPWLLLLDLLHRAGDTAGYVAASTECRRYFNVNLDGRAFFSEGENGQGLEAYPHLLEQLVHVWNTPDVKAFFEDLVFDHRGGTRIGFEPGAYRDILLLRSIAHDTRPLQKTE
jgi:Tfp pilus assembly protein FimV